MMSVKIGDIIEIKTTLGNSYAQYTHRSFRYGALIRVFKKVYRERPETIDSITDDNLRFSTFFPLKAAVENKIVEVIGNKSVSVELSEFPMFRAGVVDPSSGKVASWWLWDGENEEQIGRLTEEQKHYPIRGVWNDTLLIERIESNWTPYTDPSN